MVLATVVSLQAIRPESTAPEKDTDYPVSNTQIKWTWQLPREVRKAFNKSSHADWYIEKMIRHDSADKAFYRFYLNNGDLLDGDHHDSFLQSISLDIADNGLIVRN